MLARVLSSFSLYLAFGIGFTGAQVQPSFSVAPDSVSLEVDTRHTSGNKFEFTVTNNAASLDYITIQRNQVRTNGEAAFGVPSPEYGVSVPPGGSARMWFRWDLVGRVNPGTYTATVPFKSELNGRSITTTMVCVVRAAPSETSGSVSGTVSSRGGEALAGIRLSLTDVGTGIADSSIAPSASGTGDFSFPLNPGDYALTVDVAGYQSKTRFFTVIAGQSIDLRYRLKPVVARVDPDRVVARVVNLPSSIWTMRASADATVNATAPMGSPASSAFHGIRNGQLVWTSGFPGIRADRAGMVTQFQAADCDVSVSPDGALVAGMDYNGKLYVIDATSGVNRWSTDRAGDRNPMYPPNSPLGDGFFTCGAVAFSPDGSSLAAGGSNGSLVMFDAATGAVRWSRGFSAEIRALRFTPEGLRLAVGAGDWKFRMVDAASGSSIWEADNQFWPLFFVAMDLSGSLVGSGSKESEFRLWDAETGELRWKKSFPAGAFVSGGAVPSKARRVIVSDWGLGVHSYRADGQERWIRKLHLASIAATPDGKYIFAGGQTASGPRAALLYLLDKKGTILWEYRPDVVRNCQVQAPFQSDFFKSVAVARSGTGPSFVIKAAAACIGGSVFTFDIPVEVAAAEGK